MLVHQRGKLCPCDFGLERDYQLPLKQYHRLLLGHYAIRYVTDRLSCSLGKTCMVERFICGVSDASLGNC